MVPGYLHFDVRRGLRADMLNAAMSSLFCNEDAIRNAFVALNLAEITFVVNEHVARGVRGKVVHFYVDDELIALDVASSRKRRPAPGALWDHGIEQAKSVKGKSRLAGCNNPWLEKCLLGEQISLSDVELLFKQSALKPSVTGLALKVLDQLRNPHFIDQRLRASDALWLVCHLVMLCAQIETLDPKFITATILCVGRKGAPKRAAEPSLDDDVWLNHVLITVPVIEISDDVSVDVLAVAFLKALSSHFGARGQSVILKSGIGISSFHDPAMGLVEALWCEAHLPSSMTELGPSNDAQRNSVHEISGTVLAATDIAFLCSTLSLHGALSITWSLVQGEKGQSYYIVRFFCSDDDKREAVEAFLVKGGARDVATNVVERHELNRRIVSVPIGSATKSFAIRFCEYSYFDKTVRVEPLKEDLDSYVLQTDYSVEMARSDLLLAWKKWRGRVALESA